MGLPALLFWGAIIGAIWFLARKGRLIREARARAKAPAPVSPRALEADDTVLCTLCGAYVAAKAGACGREGCPR